MKTNMYVNASPHLFGFARKLRNNPTKAEDLLWQRLRNNQTGYKFRRQHPLSNYVVDFYCHSLRYIIEVDGDIHNESMNQLEDENRDIDLEDKGFVVQRFTNEQVINDIESVMTDIHKTLSFLRSRSLSSEE